MMTVSQTALTGVLRDIETGNTAYVDQFFADRPDWLDQDEDTIGQADDEQETSDEEP